MKPAKPCTYPGCGLLSRDGTARCTAHPREAFANNAINAEKRLIVGRALVRARAELFAREPWCRPCSDVGDKTIATLRDHVIPLAQGGRDEELNTQPICRSCHDAKSKAESRLGRWNDRSDRTENPK